MHINVCAYIRLKYPEVIFLSDGSGLKLPKGLAVKYSKMKSSRGIPDLIILEPVDRYAGLILELKKEGTRVYLKDGYVSNNKHIQEQEDVLNRLRAKGYCALFAIGYDECVKIIDMYLSSKI